MQMYGDIYIEASRADELREQLAKQLADGALTPSEHAELAAKLAARKPVSEAFLEIWMEFGSGTNKGPIRDDEKSRLQAEIASMQQDGKLTPAERADLDVQLAARPTISAGLAALANCTADQVPWFLLPFGVWSWPWRWLVATLVHCQWRDALINIGLLWSFGLVVEGKLGWRRFAPVLGGGLLATGLITTLAGLATGVVLPRSGSHDLVAFLAGICLVWAPANRIHYTRWLVVELGSFDTPIWLVLTFSATLGLLLGWLVGYPPLALFLLVFAYPMLGFATGTAIMRLGWVQTEGWDIYALWRTRHLLASDRNRLERKRQHAQNVPAPAAEVPAMQDALRTAAAEEFATELAAGRAAEAAGVFRMLRTRWPSWQAEPAALDRLSKLLWQVKDKDGAAAIAAELIARPGDSADARLMLAAVAVAAKRPAAARDHLAALPAELRPTQTVKRDTLLSRVAALEQHGEREVEFL